MDHSTELYCKFCKMSISINPPPLLHIAPMKIDLLHLFQVISIACCVFYSHCGNRAVHKSKSFGSNSDPNLLAFLENENGSTWISNFLRMNQLKDQICSSWFAPVGSASDYPMLAKWVIYGEVPLASLLFIHFLLSSSFMATSMLHFFDHVFLQLVCSGSCAGPSDEISPLYSLWATFVGLYIANFVVERSTGYAFIVLLCVVTWRLLMFFFSDT